MPTTITTNLPATRNLQEWPISRGAPWSFPARLPWALAGHTVRLVLAATPTSAAPIILDTTAGGITMTPDADPTKTIIEATLTEAQTLDIPAATKVLTYWLTIIQPDGQAVRLATGTIPVGPWRKDTPA